MTIDQFKKDLLLVAQNACDLVVSLTPQGDGNIVIILEVSVLSIILQVT